MSRKLGCAILCFPVVCLAVWAQKEPEYRTGRLVQVSDQSFVLPGSVGKTAYLLHIRDGANQYFALYNVNQVFGHDRSNQLKPESDIQYRISGKSLFVKTQDTKEIKARLCEKVQIEGSAAVKCGDLVILGKDAE
jgi:hypothetical protein